MNSIEKLQQKYMPNFYETRYANRKELSLKLKEKTLENPALLSYS